MNTPARLWSAVPRPQRMFRAIAALGLSISFFAAPASAQDVKLLLDWVPTGDYAAYYAALDRGFYKEAGLNVTIERGFGSSDTVTKIATGVAPFGVADIAAVMTGRVRSQTPVKAIASIFTRPPHSVFVLADSGIKTFKDLEGKSLAGAPGSSVRHAPASVSDASVRRVPTGTVRILEASGARMRTINSQSLSANTPRINVGRTPGHSSAIPSRNASAPAELCAPSRSTVEPPGRATTCIRPGQDTCSNPERMSAMETGQRSSSTRAVANATPAFER